jgi:DNA-binding response OmpR family regulator
MASVESPAVLLYVDDDPAMTPLVTKVLARPNWKLECLSSGEEAIARLKSSKVHLVVTDLFMPGISGKELTEHVTAHHADVPVVVVTGQGTESTAVECFNSGAADYVTKTNLNSDLAAVVAKLLHEEAQIEINAAASGHASEGSTDATGSTSSGIDESGDYIRLKWGNSLKNINAELSEETEFTPEKLRVLRRQAERLSKWNKLDPNIAQMRRHKRFHFADIVFMLPMDAENQPIFSRRFISFCCNLSAGGCSLIHSRLLRTKDFIIFFPRLAQAGNAAAALRCSIVRDRPLSMGMYELGVKFLEVAKIAEEDNAILLASHRQSGK